MAADPIVDPELTARLDRAVVDDVTLAGVGAAIDGLCRRYGRGRPEPLVADGRRWLVRLRRLVDSGGSSARRRELLALAGRLAELIGCAEYDLGETTAAESLRRLALDLGEQAGAPEVLGWGYEMRAWFALTRGDCRGAVDAADAGAARAPDTQAAVQLAAQRAKAFARLGEPRQTAAALEAGRVLLERLPRPAHLDDHFVVDPAKWDLHAMDCYRVLGAGRGDSPENRLARGYAESVLAAGTDAAGVVLAPMRVAEAQVTLGVVCARAGELEEAVAHGVAALGHERRSLPSLLMVHADLVAALEAFGGAPPVADYRDRLAQLCCRNAV